MQPPEGVLETLPARRREEAVIDRAHNVFAVLELNAEDRLDTGAHDRANPPRGERPRRLVETTKAKQPESGASMGGSGHLVHLAKRSLGWAITLSAGPMLAVDEGVPI